MSSTVSWGIIGAGSIARAFARGVANSKNAKLVAVGSRSLEKADKCADEVKAWGQPVASAKRYGSYEDLLADKDVQAVYVAVPHPMHAQWAIAAARAKKHILCEKPFALNHAEAMAMIEAAAENGVFIMEAFMYRCHPQTAKLVELIGQRAIGDVRVIQATFSFHAGFNAEGRLWSNALAGGGIMDVGCYAVSMSRLIAGAAVGKPFADPVQVTGAAQLNATTGVDEYAIGTLKFASGIVVSVATGVGVNQENVVRIFGSEGWIFVPNPWVASREGGTSAKIIVHKKGVKEPQEIAIETPVTSFALEVETASGAILAGKKQAPPPAMTPADTLGNMKTLEQWRQAVGLVYEAEKPANIPTVDRKPLAVATKNNMKYGRLPGLDKQVSRLVMGVDNIYFAPHTFVMWDDFYARGGNCWDTAYVYGGGQSERALGAWIKARGLRDKVVILDKGAHTPFCTPLDIRRQLAESLDRLQTDHTDIYMMHRDNLDIPVGEFVDVLNELKDKGLIRVFGGSNWSIARVEAFNDYAKKHGKQGFSAVSNNFSLARMVDPVWRGCIAASDADSRAWFTRTQLPLMPWSSQARGFFTERGDPANTADKELTRCWQSEDNQKRRQRAVELAARKGVEPINIALAYVLCQPFPTFPLIGPRQLSETRSSLKGLDVQLSDKELKWLNLETE